MNLSRLFKHRNNMVSIITATTMDGAKFLKQMLPIAKREPNAEVIVVDNKSFDDTEEVCKAHGVVYIKNEENMGFAVANNQGASVAKGDKLLFLNNDTIPTPGFSGAMGGFLDDPMHNEGAKMGIVGVKLVYDLNQDRVQHAGIAFTNTGYPYEFGNGKGAGDSEVNSEREMNAVTAACFITYKDLFQEVGGFYEGYRNGWEDVELCLRMREMGRRIIYTPSICIRHVHMGSLNAGRMNNDDYNRTLFKQRWIDTGRIWKIIGGGPKS